ncbi:hypothetical protein ILUMI_22195 [Ignelater luminosus]|uniref:Uncharacterized protein n=1 Tax=Ignelater luminosus TaxID=2038154 RepID=A0A8K0CEU7_IGNLU|nr:hypothetical protein ILUMI_22195 [Ignelater luminosus]
MSSNEQDVRQTVLRKWTENPLIATSELAKICKTSQRTVQRCLKKFRNTATIDRKSRDGRPTRSSDKIIEKKKRRKKYQGLKDATEKEQQQNNLNKKKYQDKGFLAVHLKYLMARK